MFDRLVLQAVRLSDSTDRRSRRIKLTEIAIARLPEAVATLLRGNREELCNFTDEEAGLLVALLMRLIAKLDQITNLEMTPDTGN